VECGTRPRSTQRVRRERDRWRQNRHLFEDPEWLISHLLNASAGNAEHRDTEEPYCDIQEVESARVAAERDDRASVLAHLGKAGKWVLDVATKVGAPVAEAALRSALLR
jgi:hypothetical protein